MNVDKVVRKIIQAIENKKAVRLCIYSKRETLEEEICK